MNHLKLNSVLVIILGPLARLIAKILSQIIFRTFTKWKVINKNNIPKKGSCIFIANHLHEIDPPLVLASIPRRVRPMAKNELFNIPFAGWYLRAYGAFPVKRLTADSKSLLLAKKILKNGKPILMFPEGTRSKDGSLKKAYPGAAMLAMIAECAIVPVAITGTKNLTKIKMLKSLVTNKKPILTVKFGMPFYLSTDKIDASSAREGTEVMMKKLAALLPKNYQGIYKSNDS
ncbi:MAG: 1-acyl-sn-glycerol-3-phosphate acyltransferase [Chloroflexi bacterium]|jgi:1-acyl-sn-glycerol-3-phosphate acyltransferase|nr:MAG: 1-acyl-sn-glycerol-3-phosphate acyltransferase [Chloroflexota bacterium]|tara:strand:+ start:4874 stop:5566 length:693 start_codon:yes stop_codon:yes gene_type:complete